MKRNFKIWAVSEGPFSVEELLYDEGYEFDIPDDGEYLVVCKVEENKKIREEEQEIVCKYAEQKRVFLRHTGTLLPCCFFNSEFLQVHSGGGNETRYTEKYQELGGPLESNLKYTSPTEVIEGDMFKFIVDSWTNKPLERCWQTCKKAKQDVFVDEVLK